MAEPGTFEKVLAEVGQALLPLREALSSPQRFSAFLISLGWLTDEVPAPLAGLGAGLETLYDELNAMLGAGGVNTGPSVRTGESPAPSVSADQVARVLHATRQVIDGVRALADAPESAIPASLRADSFATEFPGN